MLQWKIRFKKGDSEISKKKKSPFHQLLVPVENNLTI
jgi:hypothetical protein